MKDALIAGLISGIMSPLILLLIQHKLIWKRQKSLEIKYSIFIDALTALSQLATDALDPKLQSEKSSYKGFSRAVEFRPETSEVMEKSRGLVRAFFSEAASAAFDKALRSKISIDEVPCIEFEKARTDAIVLLAKELGIK